MPDPETAPVEKANEEPGVPSTIMSIASAMSRARGHGSALDAGDVADLRRMDPEKPSCSAFWKVLARWDLPYIASGDGPARDESERRWAAVLGAMATLGGDHASGVRLGRALADAGLSDSRLEGLLRARDAQLRDLLRRAVQLAASRGVTLNLIELALLVLSEANDEWAERQRRRLARDFYYVFEKKETSK